MYSPRAAGRHRPCSTPTEPATSHRQRGEQHDSPLPPSSSTRPPPGAQPGRSATRRLRRRPFSPSHTHTHHRRTHRPRTIGRTRRPQPHCRLARPLPRLPRAHTHHRQHAATPRPHTPAHTRGTTDRTHGTHCTRRLQPRCHLACPLPPPTYHARTHRTHTHTTAAHTGLAPPAARADRSPTIA